jgi:hypothetical protein
MPVSDTTKALEFARRRARAGLWIGPGFLLIAASLASVVALIVAPESRNFGRGVMVVVVATSALLHLGCFYEFVIVVRFLGHRPLPRAVLLLVGYWTLLAGILVVSAVAN